MTFKKKLNNIRRKLTRGLTKHIGSTAFNPTLAPGEKAPVNRILICRPNHRLGNLLMITPLLQEIENDFPNAKVDLFVKGGLAPILFKNYDAVDRIITLPKKPFKELIKYAAVWVKIKHRKYDIVVNVDKGSSSGRLATKVANAAYKLFGDESEAVSATAPDYTHMARQPVYRFRNNISKLGYPDLHQPVPGLSIKLAKDELIAAAAILKGLADQQKKTICLFTFATGDKCYSTDWWSTFYERLRTEFPHCNIIEVLPVENVSQLNFKIPSFYSKDVREICAFIASTDLFIGADSGIMHLAAASGKPVAGLFHITNTALYEPYGNRSQAIHTDQTNMDDWMQSFRTMLG